MLTFCFGKIPTKKTSESSVGRSLPPLNPNYTSEKATTSQEGHCNEFDRQVDIVGAAGIVLIQHDIISRTIVSSSSVVNAGKLTSELTSRICCRSSTALSCSCSSLNISNIQMSIQLWSCLPIVELPTHSQLVGVPPGFQQSTAVSFDKYETYSVSTISWLTGINNHLTALQELSSPLIANSNSYNNLSGGVGLSSSSAHLCRDTSFPTRGQPTRNFC